MYDKDVLTYSDHTYEGTSLTVKSFLSRKPVVFTLLTMLIPNITMPTTARPFQIDFLLNKTKPFHIKNCF
jgi:hypothetical protein